VASAPDACSQAKESLTVCMSFVTDLTFHSVPDTLANLVGGDAGFNILVRIFATTSKKIYTLVKKQCCPQSSDPTLLFSRLERVTKLIAGPEYKASARIEKKSDNTILLHFTGLGHLQGKLLNTAPIIGVIVGMIEAAGHRAVAATTKERTRHAPQDAYIVYPENIGETSLDLAVIPPRTKT
jgi:hypothetical protein